MGLGSGQEVSLDRELAELRSKFSKKSVRREVPPWQAKYVALIETYTMLLKKFHQGAATFEDLDQKNG